jgi:predicted RNase H-like HicB family nuclease
MQYERRADRDESNGKLGKNRGESDHVIADCAIRFPYAPTTRSRAQYKLASHAPGMKFLPPYGKLPSGSRPTMTNEFTAIIEQDGPWFIAYSPEIPGANGQGKTKEEARESLAEAIKLILDDRREDGLRGLPPDAIRETVSIK